jgi:glycosyltransferase involved in cell wall biosynthesis
MKLKAKEPAHGGFSFFRNALEYFMLFFPLDMAIEAMACGCPVVISNTGALSEISGGIGVQVNPLEISEIVNAISLLI